MMWEYFNGSEYGWGDPVLWMALQYILVIAAIVLIVFLVRKGVRGSTGVPPGPPTARQILDERYAKGEIDRETYEQMKKDIR